MLRVSKKPHPATRSRCKLGSHPKARAWESTYHPSSARDRGHAGRRVGARIRRLAGEEAAHPSYPLQDRGDFGWIVGLHFRSSLCDGRLGTMIATRPRRPVVRDARQIGAMSIRVSPAMR